MYLSIIVPVYNSELYIEQCIESLLNQDIDKNNYEIIIINDGSTDGSLRCIENLRNKNRNIIVHTQKNKGLGAVRNKGILLSKGKYIYFIDSDDYIVHNTFKLLINYLERYTLDIIGFDSIRCTRRLSMTNITTIKPSEDPLVIKGMDFLKNYRYQHRLEAWWYIIRREYLLKTGHRFEEEKFFEDAIFTYRIFRDSRRTMFLNVDIHRYVITPSSIMSRKSQNHLNKFVKDWVDLIFRFNNLSHEIFSANYDDKLILVESIRYRQKINLHYLFIKWREFDFSIKEINQILNEFEEIKIYPLKFTEEQYRQNNLGFRLSIFLFNSKYLYFVILKLARFLFNKRL